MNLEHQRQLRAMLAARREYEAATKAQMDSWAKYLEAQAAFMGHFSQNDYPVGPFVVGETLIEHDNIEAKWPQRETIFSFREVIRCPTSD